MSVCQLNYRSEILAYTFSTTGISAITWSLSGQGQGVKGYLYSIKIKPPVAGASACTAMYLSILDNEGDTILTSVDLGSAGTTKSLTANNILIGNIRVLITGNTATGVITASQAAKACSVYLYLG